jgi:hypothetical protein
MLADLGNKYAGETMMRCHPADKIWGTETPIRTEKKCSCNFVHSFDSILTGCTHQRIENVWARVARWFSFKPKHPNLGKI